MIRRTPTRIELKLEDISEYNAVRQAMDTNKDNNNPQNPPPWAYKITLNNAATIQERIGFAPQPRPSS